MKTRFLGAILAVALAVSCFTLFAFNAQAATTMKASDECVDVIKQIEGFFAIPYWDYSQWTVGFGTTCPEDRLDEYLENGIPVEDAEALLREQLAKFEKAVNDYAKKNGLNLTQGQFDALVSFTYNLGSGMLTNSTSSLGKAILSGAKENDLIYTFSLYCMAGGEVMPGLMRRRLVEANMFINGRYDDYAPDSYCYVLYDANGGTRDASAQGYDANMPVAPKSKPTRSGYEFIGWYTKAEGGVKVTSLDETTQGLTLYAHWQKSETEAEDPVDPSSGIKVIVTSTAVNLRCGPGIGYGIVSSVCAGDRLTILGTTRSNGMLWGQTKDGWIALEHTDFVDTVAPDTEEDTQKPTYTLPVMATVVGADGIPVHSGPHTTYPKLKTLKQNTQIQILEIMEFAGKEWARYSGGWVQMSNSLMIHDEDTLLHRFTATITGAVALRSGPGTNYTKLGTLAKGTSHTVYAVKTVGSMTWGRIAKGWVSLSYTNYDASKLDQYRNHIYGNWYTSVEGTCVKAGQERRDCKYCDHCETRTVAGTKHVWGNWTVTLEATCTQVGKEQRTCQGCGSKETRDVAVKGHSFGQWYVAKEPTATTAGEERRECQVCGYAETRTISPSGHEFGQWYVKTAPTCTAPGQERRDCQDCDYYETREVAPTGHSLGSWYTVREATAAQSGLQRRDCANCGYYEEKELPYEGDTVILIYGTLTGYDYLNIRSGPGSSYTAVGKLYRGDRVEILEIKTVGSTQWGRIQQGWVCITGYITLEEVGHSHSYGSWYEVKAPTTAEPGQERRDCACGHYETREIPKLEAETKLYGTVTGYDYLTIRSGPGTSYTAVGKLYRGDRVEILEIKTVGTTQWGRIQQGWVCITGYITLEDASHTHSYGAWYVTKAATTTEKGQERRDCACGHYETREIPKLEAVTRTYATITCSSLSIRAGAGTSYTRLGYYYQGETVEILEQVQVGTNTWGRTEKGWICLTGYTTLKTITE